MFGRAHYGGDRHQNALALLAFAARHQGGADRQHAAKLAMRSGLRAHRHGRHVGELAQPAGELMDQLQRPLRPLPCSLFPLEMPRRFLASV